MFDLVTLSAAVFDKPNPKVVEAYSEFDSEPQEFKSSSELTEYMEQRLLVPKSYVDLFVVYPDMHGECIKRKIELNSKKIQKRGYRYTWDGWGMISIQLHPNSHQLSGVNANSEKRALKWEGIYPEFGSVKTWDWKRVESHKRRLQRVFKKIV